MGFVYRISNVGNGKFYIGSTGNYVKRVESHISSLRRGCHHNIHLQRSFNKWGEDSFTFSILLETENWLLEEQKLLDSGDWEVMYNINTNVSGGDILSYHPDRLGIIERISHTLKKLHSLPDDENPWASRDINGVNNPNYREWSSVRKTTCSCGNNKSHSAKVCSGCQDRGGESNPFYGKTHTNYTKGLISSKNKGKPAPNRKIVMVDEVEYESMAEVAEHYNIGVPLVSYRCTKSTNTDYEGWFVKGNPIECSPRKTRGIEVSCEGVIFNSVSEACRCYGLSSCAMNNRIKSDKYPEFFKTPR